MCVCEGWGEDRLAPSQPGWPPSPCFVRRVWNVLGHRALLPGGDTGAIALISLLDRFSPSFQLRDSAGSQLPASARSSSAASVCPASGSHKAAAGSGGLPGGGVLQPGLRGPWASLFKLVQPFPSCPSSQAPSNVTPLTHSSHPTSRPPPPFWGSEVFGKPCSQDLGDLGQASVCQLPSFLLFSGTDCTGWGLCSACGRTGLQDTE